MIPLWAYQSWWSEYPKESKEYRQRYSDYLNMCRLNGIPVVTKKGEVEFATKDCEEIVNIGSQNAPNTQVICKWCGQRKDEFLQCIEVVNKNRLKTEYNREIPKPTKTAGLVRIIDPFFKESGCMDSMGNYVYTKCPHVKAWQSDFKPKSKFR